MAKQTIVTYPAVAKDSGLGTPLADAFKMVNDNFTELYNDETTGEVNSITATAPISRDQAVGPVTLSLDDLGITTGKIANDAVTEDKLANSINTAIAANTAKTGITSSQAADIVSNNAKNTDQTVSLSEGANVTITGTYPNFTIASNDVVGAVSSVNGQTAVVVLDTADISEDTNLYYTEARVAANSAVTLNTAKLTANTTNVTSAGALMDSEVTNLSQVKAFDSSDYLASSVTTITSGQASAITANTAKVTNATHTGEVTGSAGSTALTIANDAVTTAKIADASITQGKMAANSIDSNSYVDGSIDTIHIANGNITQEKMAANSIDSDQYIDGSIDTVHIANNNITHDKLENRYTAINAIGTTSGAFNIDFNLGAIQTVTLGGAHTGTFINFKIGQVIDIIITGNHALTFSATASGTPAINKVGDTAYDGTATQIIQVQCASDDSTTPIFYYACNTYADDTTP
jgi:hypothetical protein